MRKYDILQDEKKLGFFNAELGARYENSCERLPIMNMRKGFTLIELLVVIAIIAMLMAIMMPVLNMVKEQARSVVCRSNLRQYGIATRMYVDENQGRFPHTYSWLYTNAGTGGTPDTQLVDEIPDGSLWPYLKDKDAHMCPTFKTYMNQTGRAYAQYSYTMNAFVGQDHFGGVVRESQVHQPAEVFCFSEENTWLIEGLSEYVINDNNLLVGEAGDPIDCFATYHNVTTARRDHGSANLVFVDGHVGSIKRAEQENGGNFKVAWPKREPPEFD